MADFLTIFQWEQSFSQSVGLPKHVVRFLLSLFLGYPLGFVYRALVQSRSKNTQHMFFTACGLAMMYYCFGWDCIHSLLNITLAYCLMSFGGPTLTTVILSFIVNMFYLHVAYSVRLHDEFMIDWSVPHCILCLRLTGVAWDYYDGNNYNNNEISEDMKRTRMIERPTLLELTGYSYFFGGVLVGPQFPLRKYLALVDRTLQDKDISSLDGIFYGFQRLGLGLFYFVLYYSFYEKLHARYFVSDWYESLSLPQQMWYIIWFQEILWMKYLSLFLISEGSCVVTGLGYNGKDDKGRPLWDGVANMRILDYETSYSVQQVIQAFHLQTSLWLVRYVYKRLKFLGNRVLSLFLAQMFLAVWHGTSAGYYWLFFLQFIIVVFEKSISNTWEGFGWRKVSEYPFWLQCIVIPLLYLKKQFMLGYGSLPLALLEFRLIHKLFMQMYYIPIIVITVWSLVIYPLIITPLIKSRKPRAKTS